MSGGVLFQESLRSLGRCELDDSSERIVLRCLEAARKSAPLDLVYDCGAAAGLERSSLLARGTAVFFSFAAGNLADDIADAECAYLEQPSRDGPCAQFILQNLFFASAARGQLPAASLGAITTQLAQAAGPQMLELRTTTWTFEIAQRVGDAIAGLQYAAYLKLLWAGTPLEDRANAVGRALGIAGHVAKDVATSDRRALSLSPSDFAKLIDWAKESANIVRAEHLACLDATLRFIDPILQSARQ